MKKVTLFALIAAVCFISVYAGTYSYEPTDDELADHADIENFGIFSSTWWLIRSILRSLKGLNCLIKWVVGIQDSAVQFNRNVVLCGVTASKEIQAVINANVAIISTCNDIINLKSNVCDTDSAQSSGKLSNSCFVKTLAKIFSLYRQVKKAIKLTKNIPATGVNANQCLNNAVNTLTSYYTQFPSQIKSCSKLTS